MKRYILLVCATLMLAAYTTHAGPPMSGGGGAATPPIATDVLWDAAGDLLQGTGPDAGERLAKGAEGTILRAGATKNAYTTSTYADTYVQGGLLHNATANTVAALAPGAVGSFLMSNGASAALSYLAAGAANYQLVGVGITTIPVWTASTGTGNPVLHTGPTFATSVGLPATLSSAAAVTWTLMDNQASGLSFGANGAADILKVGTLDAGPTVAVAGKLSATTYGSDGTVTDAELLYLGDVTSAIQAQFTTKAPVKKVVTHTTTGSVALTCAANSAGVFTNSGAAADVTYTLEECLVGVEGCHFTFIVTDWDAAGDDFWVDPHANDQFYGMYSTNANGDKLEGDNVLGSMLNVLCLKNTAGTYEWFTSGSGVWTDQN